jgi:hypothetical protein
MAEYLNVNTNTAILMYQLSSLFDGDYYNKEEGKPFRVRSGKEQSDILKGLGYWAIEDTPSRPSQAVINEREPVQICFLVPAAFKVIDYFYLSPAKNKVGDFLVTNEPTDGWLRKLAQRILSEVFTN